MGPFVKSFVGLAGALVIAAGMVFLDFWSNGPAPFAGLLQGMALMGLLVAASALAAGKTSLLASALLPAVRTVAEGVLGIVLVFFLAAPLTVLLPSAWVDTLMRDDKATDLLVILVVSLVLMLAVRYASKASRLRARNARAERDAAMARADLAEKERELMVSELQVLRAQVEPHFLWNTLANVEYLMRTDIAKAQLMMKHLTGYLRGALSSDVDKLNTLVAEFRSIQSYVGLMQFRMGDRLQVQLNLPEELANVPFPPMVLQTLVENAIKHGLEPLPGAAKLEVRAYSLPDKPGYMVVDVQDNGVGLQPAPRTRGTGLGLRQVRERIRSLHGAAGSLSVVSRPEGGVSAQIIFPLSAASIAASSP